MELTVAIISTPELGNRTYVVHDGTSAIVVDAPRDIDRVEQTLDSSNLTCQAVLETHIHNDYLTGGAELARRTGSQYIVNRADTVGFTRTPIGDEEQLAIGDLRITAIATPGHTDTHLAYLVDTAGNAPGALFTGGSMLFGSVGRTDLAAAARTEELTRKQYRSVHRLAELPETTKVFPTHGFGSFCSAGSVVTVDSATIGEELRRNDALTAPDEAAFVHDLMAKLGPYPTYYRYMAPRNLAGPGAVELTLPPMLGLADVRAAAHGPGWVVDLRDRRTFARGHLHGAIGIEQSLNFSTYLGWILPWGIEVTLVADTEDAILAARRQLIRIGVDDIAGGFLLDESTSPATTRYPVASFAELAPAIGEVVVVDTRQHAEFTVESIRGAINIPVHQIQDRLEEIPTREVWVHCASGYRASIAASLLARAGHKVTLVDDVFDHAVALGLTTRSPRFGA